MRKDKRALHRHDLGRCKVRHVTANLARRKSRAHSIIVDQSVTREVQKRRALLHGSNFVRTDHALRLRRRRDLDRDVIAARAQVEQVIGEAEVRGDGSCALGIEERVVADRLHPQRLSCGDDEAPDSAKTDHPERLPHDFGAGELLLRLLGALRDVLVVRVVTAPCGAPHDIARSQKQGAQHELLHRVRVRAWRIEHGNPALGKRVERDVVHARARARDRLQVVGEFHLVHVRTAHEDDVGLRHVVSQLIVGRQERQPFLRDVVQAVHFVHGIPFLLVGLPHRITRQQHNARGKYCRRLKWRLLRRAGRRKREMSSWRW